MSKLKFESKTTHIIDYQDWDSYIHKNYPKCPYDSIVSEEEMSNNSTFAYQSGKLSEEQREKTVAFLNGDIKKFKLKFLYMIRTSQILDLLVEENILPEGYYNIKIFW